MAVDLRTRLSGAFHGYNGGAVFRLSNGQTWQQRHYKYRYHYAYRPEVRIYQSAGRYLMDVSGMNDPIEVVRVQTICEGTIVSDFSGFNGDTLFEFDNGQIWKQSEYKYNYHYAYRPEAMVVDGINGTELHVEDVDESVAVRRLR